MTFGGLAIGAFYTYTQVAPQVSPWYVPTLLIASIVFGVLFLVTGSIYMWSLTVRHLNPLDILDDVQCAYWPKEKQIKVTLWFCDYYNSLNLKLSCVAQFGKQIVNVTDRVDLDGMYIGNTMCSKGRKRMIEFFKDKVEITEMNKAKISVSIKPSGLWRKKLKDKEVSVSVVNH